MSSHVQINADTHVTLNIFKDVLKFAPTAPEK